jgi:hypothetical protein
MTWPLLLAELSDVLAGALKYGIIGAVIGGVVGGLYGLIKGLLNKSTSEADSNDEKKPRQH